MNNPFEELNDRLEHIENLILDIKKQKQTEVSKPFQNPKLVKIDEAAILTGYKKGYIYELVFRNAIPFIKRGRSLRFDPDELENWMRAGRPSIIEKTIKSLKEA